MNHGAAELLVGAYNGADGSRPAGTRLIKHHDRNLSAYMIISLSREFAFVHVHKTGGESVSVALAPLLNRQDLLIDGGPRYALRRHALPRYQAARHLHKHSPAAAMRDHVGPTNWSSLYSFTIVRDPLKRAFSLYRYLHTVVHKAQESRIRQIWYRTPQGRAANPESWSAVQALKETHTFGEFVRHPRTREDPGFQPQVSMLNDHDGTRLVTDTLHLENLAEEFAAVQDTLGIHPHVTLPHQNASKPSANDRLSDDITNDDRAYIAQYFADDYSSLGYPLP